ncbi:MAG TPA: hypothetical protein VNX21_06910, partial [Candidatus Thermoplasmatota archaeon]|nr:hypothetical protein [Candidatus Thermoplasmatota archaeon]
MAARNLHDELDPTFLRRQQWTQRAMWAVMLGILGAALLGYFGSSPRATEVDRVEEGGAVYEVDH